MKVNQPQSLQVSRNILEGQSGSNALIISSKNSPRAGACTWNISFATGGCEREGICRESKAAQVYALLGRPEGATRREIEQLTGWQPYISALSS
ncbi:MAG: DUF3489 domain-containing protein [Bryobacteraceae bacterium]